VTVVTDNDRLSEENELGLFSRLLEEFFHELRALANSEPRISPTLANLCTCKIAQETVRTSDRRGQARSLAWGTNHGDSSCHQQL